MQAETKFKIKVRKALETLPATWIVKTQQVAIRGTPDLLACVSGRFVALELKRSEDAEVAELQKYNIAKIRKAGGIAYLVDPANWEEVFKHLESLARHS